MRPNREHLLEYHGRWLDVGNAGFHRPRPVTGGYVHALAHGYSWAELGFGDRLQHRRRGQFRNARRVEQVARAAAFAAAKLGVSRISSSTRAKARAPSPTA